MIKIILSLLLISNSIIIAQSSSAYTRYGIGDLKYSFSPRQQALGGLGVSIQNKQNISSINPATWANFDRTKIELALSYNGLTIQNKENKVFSAETEVDGVIFGFPVYSDLGIGFAAGLIPISRVSYKSLKNINNNDSLIANYNLIFEGKGGISKIFLGSSIKLPVDILFGATFDYYFGNFKYLSAIEFLNETNFSSEYIVNYRPNGYGLSVGILSPDLNKFFNINKLSNLNLGASINYFNKLNTDSVLTSKSSNLLDTLAFFNGFMQLPIKYNVGLSFVISTRYLFTFDYSAQNFSNFKLFSRTNVNLENSYKFSTGFEIQSKNEISPYFLDRIPLRFGFSFEKTPYKFNETGIKQYSIFSGFSFPINPDNLIDVAIEYAIRGTKENNLLQENIVKLNLSLIFNELWFLRIEK